MRRPFQILFREVADMGVKKQRDTYYIIYPNGVKVCVSEELYRVWAYYYNKEYHTSKQYSARLVHKNGEDVIVPSRLVSFEDFILGDNYEQFRYNPVIAFDRSSLTDLLFKCIRALPDKQGRTIFLLYFEGLSEAKIARQLHVAQSSISNYKRAALSLLKSLLEEEGYCKEDLFSMLHR